MSIEHLSFLLVERVSLIVAVASLILFSIPFENSGFYDSSYKKKIFLACFFGLISIVGTYSGGVISESIANLRAMGVVTAGLIGGPFVGGGAALIAGLHRFLIDPFGFSTFPCAIATIIEGFAAGYLFSIQKKYPDWKLAGILTFAGESLHMVLVLFLSKSFSESAALVRVIAVPMVLGNTFGACLFTFVIFTITELREKDHSNQAGLILRIAKNTVSHLRQGLNFSSAQQTCEIIYKNLPVAAVSITDKCQILAHVGDGDDHHIAGEDVRTELTKKVLKQGVAKLGVSRSVISCSAKDCPLTSAAVVPLKKKNDIVGTLKLYGSGRRPLTPSLFEITKGLAELFSTQLELEEISVKEKMIAQAEIRRLHAQIQPHFLFNALNTIASFSRTKPQKARELILDLALYMRKNLDSEGGIITLGEEMEQVRAYISIEKARFGDRIKYIEKIESSLFSFPIPQLILQPLVENAVRHGLHYVENNGIVEIGVYSNEDGVVFSIFDNGFGIPKEIIDSLNMEDNKQTDKIGLKNCHDRLLNLYGEKSRLGFEIWPGKGTKVSFFIPWGEE